MAATKKKAPVTEESTEDKKGPKEPILFQPLTDKGDYPALVLFAYPTDCLIGVVKQEGGTPAHGGYYGQSFESMIHGVDRCLFAYKINNTQRTKLRVDEFLELLKEHKDLMENFMRGEVKKCRSKM